MLIFKYCVFILICSVLLLLINFNYNKISKFLNIYDYPDYKRKIHKKKIPLLGGLIIYVFIIFYLFVDFFFLNKSSFLLFSDEKQFFYFIFIGSVFFIYGLFDDKFNLPSSQKLFIYFSTIFIFLTVNETFLITNINSLFLKKIFYFNFFSYFFTSFAIILFIISLNIFDGINMQTILYVLFFLIILLFKFNYNLLFLFLIFILIFPAYLNYKNRIFMGESGVNFLSFILSYFIIIAYNQKKIIFVEEILLIMAIPGFDFLRVALLRLFSGKNPLSSDNLHIHYKLLSKFNQTQVALYIFVISVLPYLLFLIYPNLLLSILFSIFLYCLSLYISRLENIKC